MMYLNYYGWISCVSTIYRYKVEIWCRTQPNSVGGSEVTFPISSPLVLEWSKTAKETVIAGSTATLTVLSPSDRALLDLYTVEAGAVMLRVYRIEGATTSLHWVGTLDTELYEEPYQWVKDYPVTLTFADFGILHRKTYHLSGQRSLQQLLDCCMDNAELWKDMQTSALLDVETCISTKITIDSELPLALNDLYLQSANWYDEDNMPMTLYDVLEAALQPLALKVVQRAGKIYVYDINSLAATQYSAVEKLVWQGTSSTLSTDVVYNNIVITWNPYVSPSIAHDLKLWDKAIDPEAINLTEDAVTYTFDRALSYLSYFADSRYWNDPTAAGFTLWLSSQPDDDKLAAPHARRYKIAPQIDGGESEGIALAWCGAAPHRSTSSPVDGTEPEYNTYGLGWYFALRGPYNVSLLTVRLGLLPLVPRNLSETLYIRLSINMLWDYRFNPFEEAVDYNDILLPYAQAKSCDLCRQYVNYLYVPVRLALTTDDGQTLYWTNKDTVIRHNDHPITTITPESCGTWGTEPDYGYICYYNAKDRINDCGLLGWHRNRHAINAHNQPITSTLQNLDDGQYITYPSGVCGMLTMEVLTGWIMTKAGWTEILSDPGQEPEIDQYTLEGDVVNLNGDTTAVHTPVPVRYTQDGLKWLLMEAPSVDVVTRARFDNTLDTGTVEYAASLLSTAKEPLSIDTLCGTKNGGVAMARGAYMTARMDQQTTFTRAGYTAQVEKLLIATLYSQYARRCLTLTGVIQRTDSLMLAEHSHDGTKFLVVSDVEDLQDDTSQVVITEIREDCYEQEQG